MSTDRTYDLFFEPIDATQSTLTTSDAQSLRKLPLKVNSSKLEFSGTLYAQEALMKKSRFTETQIVGILKEADAGMKVSELCRKHGISDATYYNWKAKYGGMSASELKRMKDMEAELSQLKRMYADLALENRAMKDLIEKKL